VAKCYITGKECEYYEDEECRAVFKEQCAIANTTDAELKEQGKVWQTKHKAVK